MKNIVWFILVLAIIGSAEAANKVDVYFFYGQGCPHCAKEEIFLENMQEKYPEINVYAYEVYSNNENRMLFESYSAMVGESVQGVPTTFIDRKAHIGFSDSIGLEIENEVKRCIEESCTNFEDDGINKTVTPVPQKYNKEMLIGWIMIIILICLTAFFTVKIIVRKNKKERSL